MSDAPCDTDCDVAIVGAGQAGAALAALLLRHTRLTATRIVLLAPDAAGMTAAPPANADAELRVVALSRASRRVLEHAGAWEQVPTGRLCFFGRMRVWHASLPVDGLSTLDFDAAEVGEPELGVIAENSAVTRACLRAYRDADGQVIEAGLRDFSVQDSGVQLRLTDGRAISARLIVGADGADSVVREGLGIELQRHAYGQRAIVATVATDRPHQHTAWQRFLPSGPVALLPLFNGCVSIVWSADDALAQQLLALPPAEFARRLESATDGVLGGMQLRSERASFPLQRATARRLVASRGALIGDAAHRIHPLAGQGLNLGFLDAAALCGSIAAALAEGEDPGSRRSLRRYEQQRLTHDALTSLGMSAFNTLFSQAGAAGWFGSRLLALAGATALARRALARRAIGLDGDVPALAR